MSGALYQKVVIVTRKTVLEELIERHGTWDQARFLQVNRGQSFDEVEEAHELYHSALKKIKNAIPSSVRSQVVERNFLPNFLMSPRDFIVTLGQDGLVVNVAKYLQDQPIMACNPDPQRIDGVLVPYRVGPMCEQLELALSEANPACKRITLAQVTLQDGQRMCALNDLFIGIRSHASARYRLSYRGQSEEQSSSGIIVSTGAGSTGWFRSIVTGAAAVASGFVESESVGDMKERYRFDMESEELRFSVREPFISRSSAASMVYGSVHGDEELHIVSRMPKQGIIFSDGMESDFLQFESGMLARIGVADRKVRLLKPE